MRRIVFAVLSTITSVVLLFSYHTSTNDASTSQVAQAPAAAGAASPTQSATQSPTSSPTSSPTQSSAASGSSAAKSTATTYTGDSVNTRWGIVQVRITVKGGKITASEAVQYPQENHKDVEINEYALPILSQEVVQAQSATVDTVSGATVTSDGYKTSLQSAIDQANL